jgi:asparagine synthase (glutamine-hydrolysing)
MSGIAGCTRPGARREVELMLSRIAHRGPAGRAIRETEAGTLGVAWTRPQAAAKRVLYTEKTAQDSAGKGRAATAVAGSNGLLLTRDPLGIAPLYFARSGDGALYFASEVKALVPVSRNIQCMPPGYHLGREGLRACSRLAEGPFLTSKPQVIAQELHDRLASSVQACITGSEMGSWLSGGLDSSVMAALARPRVDKLHTFAAGVPGAPDLEHACAVASFVRSDHHEVIVDLDQMLAVLPDVIYHLESFDALLVRSSIMNYLVGRAAADHVFAVLSGEGGDELFAGYAYLKEMETATLAGELIDITQRLHNTALQRVDRCSAAHGLLARVPFLSPDVVDYAMRIPVELKLQNGVEKWIVRQAATGLLPGSVLERTKSKFWEGAGVSDLLSEYAETQVSDYDFRHQRRLENGFIIRTKEEMMYYRIFRRHFGDFADLDWMGRTKGAPQA